jgi:5-methyltetrahydropteroyltriglutamate--homocysteine methyltransferase
VTSIAAFRADQCGSLIRPEALRQARRDRFHGHITDEQLAKVEDQAIIDLLAMQKRAGIRIYTDGEFRRRFWLSTLIDSLNGLEDTGPDMSRHTELTAADLEKYPELAAPNPTVVGRISRDKDKRNLTFQESLFLKQHSPGPFKITLPAVSVLRENSGLYKKGISDHIYPDPEEFWEEVTKLLEEDIATAALNGASYIQVDNPEYTKVMSYQRRELLQSKGVDPDQWLEQTLREDNRLLSKIKATGARAGLHICLGTYIGSPKKSKAVRVEYDPKVVSRVFETTEAESITCEYSERSGTLESLKLSPKLGKKVIALGMVNVVNPELENEEQLVRNLKEISQYVPLSNLAICPNCGFSGASANAFMSEADEQKKLELIVRVADKVWGSN